MTTVSAASSEKQGVLRRQLSNLWWLERWNYAWFMLREWSSAFVAYFIVVTLAQISAIEKGGQVYANFEAWLKTPLALTLNSIAFIFLVFHAVSWFHLVPRAMFPRVGGQPTSEVATTAPGYVLWLIASVIVAGFVLGVF